MHMAGNPADPKHGPAMLHAAIGVDEFATDRADRRIMNGLAYEGTQPVGVLHEQIIIHEHEELCVALSSCQIIQPRVIEFFFDP